MHQSNFDLARQANVSRSSIDRFIVDTSEMSFKIACEILAAWHISPTQAADCLGLVEPLPESESEKEIIEAAWMLSLLPECDQQAIIRIIKQRFEMITRKEVS